MKPPVVSQVASNAYLAQGHAVNWVILTDGDDVTLIDAGYPAYLPAIEQSLHSIGRRPEQISAVLITHAHVDHIGALPGLLRRHEAPVFMSDREVHHAKREYLEQATPMDVITNLWRPGFLPWSVHLVQAGALKDAKVPTAQPFPREGALDLPGNPVPIATPGHTSGHSCYHVPSAGLVATGDTLASAHPTSPIQGPQLLPAFFSHDQAATIAALDQLERLDAGIMLPGHGPAHRGALAAAVATARERALSQ